MFIVKGLARRAYASEIDRDVILALRGNWPQYTLVYESFEGDTSVRARRGNSNSWSPVGTGPQEILKRIERILGAAGGLSLLQKCELANLEKFPGSELVEVHAT